MTAPDANQRPPAIPEQMDRDLDELARWLRTGHDEHDQTWFRACREIIDRCVAPDMYANALAMLERAAAEARKRVF
jgi:hypothetical protein